jgi:hypothetical protein
MQFIEACFIGGELDGQVMVIPPHSQEWVIAVAPELNLSTFTEEQLPEMVEIHRQIYRSIGIGNIFWLHRIEK